MTAPFGFPSFQASRFRGVPGEEDPRLAPQGRPFTAPSYGPMGMGMGAVGRGGEMLGPAGFGRAAPQPQQPMAPQPYSPFQPAPMAFQQAKQAQAQPMAPQAAYNPMAPGIPPEWLARARQGFSRPGAEARFAEQAPAMQPQRFRNQAFGGLMRGLGR